MKGMEVFLAGIILLTNIIGCASELHTGHLIVSLTDKESGQPITNATVSVRSQIMSCLVEAPERFFSTTSAQTDTNGIAHVEFQFKIADFDWWVTSPSYHTEGSRICNEHFYPIIEKSDYLNIDTNTVDGLSKFNEIKALYESDNPDDYNAFVKKFNPKSVTYTNDVIHRSASFYPKYNPRPMYIYYDDNYEWTLDGKNNTVKTNEQNLISYREADIDLKEGAFLEPHIKDGLQGSVADFKLERYLVITNGVKNFFGWLSFSPNCGAYKGLLRNDKSFPNIYAADVSATYTNRIFFSYCRDAETGRLLSAISPLEENEYLVLRTRHQIGADGTNGWHYSELIGPMKIGRRLSFKQTIFNPVFNDPNLEYDRRQNLAE